MDRMWLESAPDNPIYNYSWGNRQWLYSFLRKDLFVTWPTTKNQKMKRCSEMCRTNCAKIHPSLLPPSPRVAYYHGLCVYHQIKVWKALSDTDLQPIQWIWKLRNDSFMADEEPGPSEFLKIAQCTCKEMCDKRCSRRKSGLTCTPWYKEFHGLFFNNSQ